MALLKITVGGANGDRKVEVDRGELPDMVLRELLLCALVKVVGLLSDLSRGREEGEEPYEEVLK